MKDKVEKVSVPVRMPLILRKQADALFADLGMDMTTAVNAFLQKAVRDKRIPFSITLGRTKLFQNENE